MTPSYSPSSSLSRPIAASSAKAQTLWLLCLAMALTVVGCAIGATFALPILASGWIMMLFIAELAIIWTAPMWQRKAPLNIILFCAFPLLSGITLTPIIAYVLVGYANGAAILLNALVATSLLTASSALIASMSRSDLGGMFGGFLLNALIGLIIFGLLQLFFPSLRGPVLETLVSGAGIVIFSLFLAVDFQRLSRRADLGSPFLLALSLYLDIYNLFLYVLRFMMAFGGRNR